LPETNSWGATEWPWQVTQNERLTGLSGEKDSVGEATYCKKKLKNNALAV